jgi:hypothetical protein
MAARLASSIDRSVRTLGPSPQTLSLKSRRFKASPRALHIDSYEYVYQGFIPRAAKKRRCVLIENSKPDVVMVYGLPWSVASAGTLNIRPSSEGFIDRLESRPHYNAFYRVSDFFGLTTKYER